MRPACLAAFAARLLLAAVLVPAAATAAPAVAALAPRAHPLEGRIYLPGEARFASEAGLIERLARAAVVYLGEKHDHPLHHRLQARLLAALVERGRRPALAFEMFPRDRQAALSAWIRGPEGDLGRLARIMDWKESGWPDWKMYAPLVAIARRAGLALVAADLPRRLARAVARKGAAGLPPGLRRELALGPPDPRRRARMIDELFASHCRMVPKKQLGGLYTAWRLRNRAMASALVRAMRAGAEGAVLITGVGHASRTLGVPPHVSALAPGTAQFALAFTETRPGEASPRAYLPQPGAYDAMWFTRPHPREDPCRKFRRALEGMRKGRREKEGPGR